MTFVDRGLMVVVIKICLYLMVLCWMERKMTANVLVMGLKIWENGWDHSYRQITHSNAEFGCTDCNVTGVLVSIVPIDACALSNIVSPEKTLLLSASSASSASASAHHQHYRHRRRIQEQAQEQQERQRLTARVNGSIALVYRGGCPFATKVRNVQILGGIGVIVGNTDGDDDDYLTMTSDGEQTDDIRIPSIFILYEDYEYLYRRLSNATEEKRIYAMIDTDGMLQEPPNFLQSLVIFVYLLLIILFVWCAIICLLTSRRALARCIHRSRRTKKLMQIPVVLYKNPLEANEHREKINESNNCGLNEALNPQKEMEKSKMITKNNELFTTIEMSQTHEDSDENNSPEIHFAVMTNTESNENNEPETNSSLLAAPPTRSHISNKKKAIPMSFFGKIFVRNKKVDVQPRNTTCAICLDDFESGQAVKVLTCSHGFHVNCIDPWLVTSSELCPVCKKSIFDKE